MILLEKFPKNLMFSKDHSHVFLFIKRSERFLLSRPTGHNFGNNKLLSPKCEISKPD